VRHGLAWTPGLGLMHRDRSFARFAIFGHRFTETRHRRPGARERLARTPHEFGAQLVRRRPFRADLVSADRLFTRTRGVPIELGLEEEQRAS